MELPPTPSAPELEKLLSEAEEQERIFALGPTKAELIEAFGESSMITDADGKWTCAITREYWPEEYNLKRINLFNEMMRKKREAQEERSLRLAADRDDNGIHVIGPGGDHRIVDPWLEDAIARKSDKLQWQGKPGFRPARKTRRKAVNLRTGEVRDA